MIEKELTEAVLQLRQKHDALAEWMSGLEARISATRMAIIYALDEATQTDPNRILILRKICDRLEAPGARYDNLTERQQQSQMIAEHECAQLSHAMREYLLL